MKAIDTHKKHKVNVISLYFVLNRLLIGKLALSLIVIDLTFYKVMVTYL